MELQEKYLTELQERQLRLVKYYGPDHQLKRLTEECGELIVAIAKFQRSGQHLNIKKKEPSELLTNLISEIADVENLIEQIKLDYGLVSDGVVKVKEYKVNRELDRIGG
ncbi:MAG: hypothetical protein RIN55_05655 [Tissierellaceae bacterium]|nr:hypothetical protein [Tissierellaceae bacterium]